MWGNRFLLHKLEKDENYAITALIVIVIVMMFMIGDILYLHLKLKEESPKTVSTESPLASSPSPALSGSSLISVLPTPTPSPTLTPPLTIGSSLPQSAVKDYFIPLGSGATQAGSWTAIPGMEAVVDFGQYGSSIKAIYFEVSIVVPTANQNVSVMLYNATDQHPVWNSTVSMSGGNASAYLVSIPISWTTGSKLYQVQAQTQLQYATTLPQARIHIVLE